MYNLDTKHTRSFYTLNISLRSSLHLELLNLLNVSPHVQYFQCDRCYGGNLLTYSIFLGVGYTLFTSHSEYAYSWCLFFVTDSQGRWFLPLIYLLFFFWYRNWQVKKSRCAIEGVAKWVYHLGGFGAQLSRVSSFHSLGTLNATSVIDPIQIFLVSYINTCYTYTYYHHPKWAMAQLVAVYKSNKTSK